MTVQELINYLSDPTIPKDYKMQIHSHNDVFNKYKDIEEGIDINPDMKSISLYAGMIYDYHH